MTLVIADDKVNIKTKRNKNYNLHLYIYNYKPDFIFWQSLDRYNINTSELNLSYYTGIDTSDRFLILNYNSINTNIAATTIVVSTCTAVNYYYYKLV